jgi:hypothetical protein
LSINRLLPREKEPVGWSNLFKYLNSQEFKDAFDFAEFVVVQIDTGTCEDWKENIKNIGDDDTQIESFIKKVKEILIKKIGDEFYSLHKEKILFAICVHDIECWLLPFNTDKRAIYSKMVGCQNAIERIANKNEFSIDQKGYQESKYYDDLSKDMKKYKILMQNYSLNPSLRIFINTLLEAFPK